MGDLDGGQTMKLGIVGSEAAKFGPLTERAARAAITSMIRQFKADLVISGRSPLGGIDLWAVQEANKLGVATREYEPKVFAWSPPGGYRSRNLDIARNSDVVVCITLRELPEGYHGMRFPHGCYHCQTPASDHVKSGGCWTMWEAKRKGKTGLLIVVNPDGSLVLPLNVLRQSAGPSPGG
jgi:hypothetical protein